MDTRYDSAGSMRTIARGTGTVLAIFLLIAFLPKLISDLVTPAPPPSGGRGWEGEVMLAMFLTYMIGYAIGWWRSLVGGIIICLAAAIVSAPFVIIQGHFNSLIFGIPVFIVGILYIIHHGMELRQDRNG